MAEKVVAALAAARRGWWWRLAMAVDLAVETVVAMVVERVVVGRVMVWARVVAVKGAAATAVVVVVWALVVAVKGAAATAAVAVNVRDRQVVP